MEVRKKCDVCGKIWCYTDRDLTFDTLKNISNTVSAIGGVASAFGGNIFQQKYFSNQMHNNKVTDRNQCPFCGSRDWTLLTDVVENEEDFDHGETPNEQTEQEKEAARLEDIYATAQRRMASATDAKGFTEAATRFAELNGYKDAEIMHKQCLQNAEDIQRKVKANRKKALITAAIVIPVAIIGILLMTRVSKNAQMKSAYDEALSLAENGNYNEAMVAFNKLGDYKDSEEQAKEARYNKALQFMERERYDNAASEFAALEDYKDSAELQEKAENAEKEVIYQYALADIAARKYQDAYDRFEILGDYKDSKSIAQQIVHEYEVCENAYAAYYESDLEPLLKAIEENEYVTIPEEDVATIHFIDQFIGRWEYLSGDSRVLTMNTKDSSYFSECLVIETSFMWNTNDTPCIVVHFSDTYYGFEANLKEEMLAPKTNGNADIYAELTASDILLFRAERKDGTTFTGEYKRIAE